MSRLFLLFGFACLTACQHLPSTTTTTETTPAPLSQKEQAKQVLDKGIVAYQAKDYATALPFFQQAQTLGHSKASRYLGLMALNGYGMAQNPQRALSILQPQAKQVIQQVNIGLHIVMNKGLVPQKMLNKHSIGIKILLNVMTMFLHLPFLH